MHLTVLSHSLYRLLHRLPLFCGGFLGILSLQREDISGLYALSLLQILKGLSYLQEYRTFQK